MDIPGNNKP